MPRTYCLWFQNQFAQDCILQRVGEGGVRVNEPVLGTVIGSGGVFLFKTELCVGYLQFQSEECCFPFAVARYGKFAPHYTVNSSGSISGLVVDGSAKEVEKQMP